MCFLRIQSVLAFPNRECFLLHPHLQSINKQKYVCRITAFCIFFCNNLFFRYHVKALAILIHHVPHRAAVHRCRSADQVTFVLQKPWSEMLQKFT